MKDLNTVRVTPLRKGTKGKIRPITIGATIKRFGLSAILKADKSIQKAVSPQEFAIGRKAALEDLKRTVDAAIAKHPRRTRAGDGLPAGLLVRVQQGGTPDRLDGVGGEGSPTLWCRWGSGSPNR